MAHAVALPHPAPAREPLDGSRIAAHAGTIFLNGLLLLALLVPLTQHVAQLPVKDDDAITVVPVPMRRPIEPPPPERVEITRQPPRTNAPTVPQPPSRVPAPVETQIVDTQPGDIAITAPDIAASDTSSSLDAVAPSAAQLQALVSPPPPYPTEAMRSGLRGVVELEILVGTDGRALDVRIVRSSGHRVLDQAARRTVLTKWTFVPAMRDGQAVQALGRVPIEFRLSN